MAYKYNDFKDKVSEIIRDDAGKLSTTERDNYIQEGVKIYNAHRPREIVKDITGDGTYYYAIATHLGSWAKGFSRVKSIEYPADEREPSYLEEGEEFSVYEKEDGQYIRFFKDVPLATEKARIVYTALHILSNKIISGTFSFASADNSLNRTAGSFLTDGLFPGNKIWTPSANNPGPFTIKSVAALKVIFWEAVITAIAAAITIEADANTIPEIDQDALCEIAASLCSGALAQAYAQTSDATIGADSVNYRTKSQEYAARAKAQKQIYLDHLGLKEGDVAPASVIKNFDIGYPDGTDRLTHPRKLR
jgi:hypothetical protein